MGPTYTELSKHGELSEDGKTNLPKRLLEESVASEFSSMLERMMEYAESSALATGEKAGKGQIYLLIGKYIRELRKIPLLTKEEEISLSKGMEIHESKIDDLLVSIGYSPDGRIFSDKVKMFRERLRAHNPIKSQGEIEELEGQLEHTHSQYVRFRNTMVISNLRLVINRAKKYQNLGLSFLDLINEGNLGLMKATEKFDYKRGYRFSTYATWWIRQHITRAIANQAKTLRIPVYMVEMANKFRKTKEELTQEYGREPKLEEVAERMEIPLKKAREIELASTNPISLSTPIGDYGEGQFGDIIEDKKAESPAKVKYKLMLEEALKSLEPREKKILEMRYGLSDGIPRTLQQVADEERVTRERVRQIEAKAFKRLRPKLRKRFADSIPF